MNQNDKVLQWAEHYLISHRETNAFRYEIVADTSYSIVYKIETTKGNVYLKQVPKALFLEPRILHFLHQSCCKTIPEVIAENADLNCFITTSCGDISLRHKLNGTINFEELKQGIEHYTNIQRLLESKIGSLLALNIPDWRLNRLPILYKELIENNQLLLGDGLTQEEIDQLQKLYSTCIRLCDNLSQYNIPETINHCDFHENNMVLDKKTGAIHIIDWGETVVTHPFLSLNTCLWNLTYFYKLKQTDALYHQLQLQCISPWLNMQNEKALLEIFKTAHQLLGIFAALSFERLYKTTKNQSKTIQQEHPGSIAGCLRTFLSTALS